MEHWDGMQNPHALHNELWGILAGVYLGLRAVIVAAEGVLATAGKGGDWVQLQSASCVLLDLADEAFPVAELDFDFAWSPMGYADGEHS